MLAKHARMCIMGSVEHAQTCKERECSGLYHARGLCRFHYQRWCRRGNRTLRPYRVKTALLRLCAIEGCPGGSQITRGLCPRHYQRLRKHGSPLALKTRRVWRVKTSEYGIWSGMKSRCYNPRTDNYKHYGGRGIAVCDRWRNSFDCFLADIGPRPSLNHSLDRINNDGNYEPGNVRWASVQEQRSNTRRNRVVTFRGVTQTLAQWSRSIGISESTLHRRIASGLPLDEALIKN